MERVARVFWTNRRAKKSKTNAISDYFGHSIDNDTHNDYQTTGTCIQATRVYTAIFYNDASENSPNDVT